MNRRTKALQFSADTKKRILARDNGCIFCQAGYCMESSTDFAYKILDCMHIVGRAQGGLGIEENGVTGCRYHHQMMDNGSEGRREEMLEYIGRYMKANYPGWNKDRMFYKKGGETYQ